MTFYKFVAISAICMLGMTRWPEIRHECPKLTLPLCNFMNRVSPSEPMSPNGDEGTFGEAITIQVA